MIIQLDSKTEPNVAKAHNYIGGGTLYRKNKKFTKAGDTTHK